MYKALIVDDELHVRQAVMKLGNWSEFHISHPVEADNGQAALVLMECNQFDIVIVDLKMPVMDGMEFIRQATQKHANTKFIILSGYSDFEYAKKAIKYHVTDYLLKPIISEELNQSLHKAVKELEKDTAITEYNPVFSIINKLNFMYKENSDFCLVLIHPITHLNANQLSNTEDISNILSFGLSKFKITLTQQNCDYLLAIQSNTDVKISLQQDVIDSIEIILNSLETENQLKAIAAISECSNRIKDIYILYENLLDIINNVNLLEKSKNIYTYTEKEFDYKRDSVIDKKSLFIQAIEKGNMLYAKSMLEKYFEGMEKSGYLSIYKIKQSCAEFLLVFKEIADEKNIPNSNHILLAPFNFSSISSFNYKEVIDYLIDLLSQLYENMRRDQRNSIFDIIHEIKDFIDQNYYRNISLVDFSEKYHLTKEYLSKQFKEQHGCGIYEYMLNFRMQKAAEMLRCSKEKIQYISECVGYSDSNYFSRAFKNYYGVSPKEYRMAM